MQRTQTYEQTDNNNNSNNNNNNNNINNNNNNRNSNSINNNRNNNHIPEIRSRKKHRLKRRNQEYCTRTWRNTEGNTGAEAGAGTGSNVTE